MFGSFLVEHGLITGEQFLEALDRQRKSQIMIGQAAVETGMMTRDEVLTVLAHQINPRGEPSLVPYSRMPFGEIAVKLGIIDPIELERLVAVQLDSRPKLGEILIEMGIFDRTIMDKALADCAAKNADMRG